MTVQEIMERTGMDQTTLAIAWIKDAMHLIKSNSKDKIKVEKQSILKTVHADGNIYELPDDMIALENISVKDTAEDRYKKIRRLNKQPHYLLEDVSP